jgi:hypothetical protein
MTNNKFEKIYVKFEEALSGLLLFVQKLLCYCIFEISGGKTHPASLDYRSKP